jgi:hypothetical protein
MLQVTLVFDVLLTVAVNSWVVPITTWAVDGETDTEIGRIIVTDAVPDFVGSATEVAVINTSAGVGAVAGAV